MGTIFSQRRKRETAAVRGWEYHYVRQNFRIGFVKISHVTLIVAGECGPLAGYAPPSY